MAYRSLAEFLDRLERAGELVRVREPVDPVLDMAALADRAAKQGGPALLFESPASGAFPVAMNLFGTRRRTTWALSCEDFEEHAAELRALLQMAPPQSLWDKLKMLPKLGKLAAMAPKHVSSGAVAGGGRPRARPRQAPGAHHLAARRRPVHHAAAGHHPRPGDRHPQRRHVPPPGPRAAPARDALAAPQDRDRPLPRLQEARRAHAGRHRARRRPGAHLLRLGAAPAERRRVPLRRLPAAARRCGW